MTTHKSSGYLEIIMGPMFSGKTTKLIQVYKNYSYIGEKVAVINYSEDKRYTETMLSTHDRTMVPCIFVKQLSDVWSNVSSEHHEELLHSNVVLINEAQFFPDLYDVVLELVE